MFMLRIFDSAVRLVVLAAVALVAAGYIGFFDLGSIGLESMLLDLVNPSKIVEALLP